MDLGVEFLGQVVTSCSGCSVFLSHQQCMRTLVSPLYYHRSTRRAAVSHYGSDLCIPNDVEHLFLENVYFKFRSVFPNGD